MSEHYKKELKKALNTIKELNVEISRASEKVKKQIAEYILFLEEKAKK